MLSGRVNTIAAIQFIYFLYNTVCLPAGDVIKIERDNISAGHVDRLAAASIQRTAHKAAYVLQIVLLVYAIRHILTHSSYKRGSRALWLVVSIVGMTLIGPILYILLGKEDA